MFRSGTYLRIAPHVGATMRRGNVEQCDSLQRGTIRQVEGDAITLGKFTYFNAHMSRCDVPRQIVENTKERNISQAYFNHYFVFQLSPGTYRARKKGLYMVW